jgi:hypothetical protein
MATAVTISAPNIALSYFSFNCFKVVPTRYQVGHFSSFRLSITVIKIQHNGIVLIAVCASLQSL